MRGALKQSKVKEEIVDSMLSTFWSELPVIGQLNIKCLKFSKNHVINLSRLCYSTGCDVKGIA